MRKFIGLVIAFALAMMMVGASIALGDDVVLSWNAATGAASYKIQMSIDQGVTWATERPVPSGTTFIWTGAPATGLVLFRVVSINSAGQAIRTDAGVWKNNSWKPPDQAGGFGVQ
jgi:hypothetical protein